MQNEVWKNIEWANGLYQVSNTGKIRSVDGEIMRSDGKKYTLKGRILKYGTDKKGYQRTVICRRTVKVHRVVAEAFLKNETHLPEVNHKDGNKKNNSVENLEWVTHADNARHAKEIGKYGGRKSKLSDDDLADIRGSYVKQSKTHGTNALAEKYGINSAYVWRIVSGQKMTSR